MNEENLKIALTDACERIRVLEAGVRALELKLMEQTRAYESAKTGCINTLIREGALASRALKAEAELATIRGIPSGDDIIRSANDVLAAQNKRLESECAQIRAEFATGCEIIQGLKGDLAAMTARFTDLVRTHTADKERLNAALIEARRAPSCIRGFDRVPTQNDVDCIAAVLGTERSGK